MISLGGLTIAALINGINPCGIGMMITFLGYLLVFAPKNAKNGVAKMGAVYVGSVFLAYLLLGLFFYGAAYYLQRLWIASVFKYVMGGGVILAGLVQLKDVIFPDLPLHLRMSDKAGDKVRVLMGRMSYLGAMVAGLAVTAFSTPCMLPLYVGTATVLARSGLPMVVVLVSFVYYNIIFILPLVIVLLVVGKGKQIVEMKEWEHRWGKWMRLLMGVMMMAVGYMIVK